MTAPAFDGWAVVELLGHRVRYGRASEVTMFGEAFVKIEIPSEPPAVEYYSGKALYGIRPASEDLIRAYHAPRAALSAGSARALDEDIGDHDDEDDGTCGGCSGPLLIGEPTVRVADHEDSDNEIWHERCAKEHAELVDDSIDGDAPIGGVA